MRRGKLLELRSPRGILRAGRSFNNATWFRHKGVLAQVAGYAPMLSL